MLWYISCLLLVTVSYGHYHIHDWNVMDQSGVLKQAHRHNNASDDPCEFAPLVSYHIHVLFWQHNKDHVANAMKLRDSFIAEFGLLGKPCTITAGDPAPDHAMCVFNVAWKPVGPFTVAQFSFFIPVKDLTRTSSWMLQHKGVHDVFIHPNSGCVVHDHVKWSVFSGKSWPIDTTCFTCHHPGCVQQLLNTCP